ncbi:MAG: ABC transporter substrate-binding protein [Chloroflexota bacterium]
MKPASRRHLMVSALTALSTGALAACSTREPSSAPAAKRQEPATLRYVASFKPAEGTTFGSGIARLVELFNAKGTPVQVQPITPTENRNQAVLAMVAAGDPPDLFHAHPRDYHPFANTGALLALDPYMKQDKKLVPDLVPVIPQYWARGDKHYAMPNNWSPQAIYFNKSLFDKHGLKTPDQYEKEGKWTFDVYLDLARKLTSGAGGQKIWGAPWTSETLDIQLSFIWPFGGRMWDQPMQNTLLDSKESLEAIQFQADLSHKYGVSPTREEQEQLSRGIGGAISAGRGGMEIMTTDVVGMLVPATFEKGMAPMPKGRAGRIVRAAPLGVHIMQGSKHPDAAWEYLAFQSGPEGARLMLEMHLTVPWLKSLLGSKAHAQQLLPWESAAYYAESSNKVRPTPYPSQFSEINKLYRTAYREVRAGQKPAQQAIGEIKSQITELLR